MVRGGAEQDQVQGAAAPDTHDDQIRLRVLRLPEHLTKGPLSSTAVLTTPPICDESGTRWRNRRLAAASAARQLRSGLGL
jgi:hypothetical protein